MPVTPLTTPAAKKVAMTTASSGIGRSNMPLDAGNITHGATEVGLAPAGSAPTGTTTTALRGGRARSIRALLALQLGLQTIGMALVARSGSYEITDHR
jgi:hypothetical protein